MTASTTRCWECGTPVIAADDDACVCTDCGGWNRRVRLGFFAWLRKIFRRA